MVGTTELSGFFQVPVQLWYRGNLADFLHSLVPGDLAAWKPVFSH